MGLKCFFTQTQHDDQIWGSEGSDWALRMKRQILESPDCPHQMTDDPAEANVIVFWEPHQDSQRIWAPRLREHPLIHRFPNKLLVVSVEDTPLGFLPGIYTSLPRSRLDPTRHRTWVYDRTLNHHVLSGRDSRRVASPANLASFRGASSAGVRAQLFLARDSLARQRVQVTETGWNRFAAKATDPELEASRIAFVDAILDAKFSLCPRGNGVGSYRLQESMALGRAPVILSDEWVPVTGPRWHDLAIFVKERDCQRLPEILRQHEDRWEEMGRRARETYDAFFHPRSFAVRALEQICDIHRSRTRDERAFIARWPRLIEAAERRFGKTPRA